MAGLFRTKDLLVSKARRLLCWLTWLAMINPGTISRAGERGEYQATRNGATTVWNNEPKTGDEATWSGGRDREGYAHGFGTLIWYTKRKGADVPELYARYWGRMEHGKFNGPVNVHVRKKTNHALFAEGERLTRWQKGRAPSRLSLNQAALLARQKAVEPEAPATGPIGINQPARPREEYVSSAGPSDEANFGFESVAPADRAISEFLRRLVWPPTTLLLAERRLSAERRGLPPPAAAAWKTLARLTSGEATGLADAAAEDRGYDLASYERGAPIYDPADRIWSISYQAKLLTSTTEVKTAAAKSFHVAVSDRSRRTVVVAESR